MTPDAKYHLSNKHGVTVKYKRKPVLRGSKCARTGLWLVPLEHKINQETTNGVADPFANLFTDFNLNDVTQELNTAHAAANVATVLNTSSMEELAKFYHQSLGSPQKMQYTTCYATILKNYSHSRA